MVQTDSKANMISGADLLRRGATLLQEPCQKCGGVQIKYEGKTYCTNEDDLGAILSPKKPAPKQIAEPIVKKEEKGQQTESGSDTLRKLLENKLETVSRQLDNTSDLQEQGKLLDLISKYIETLEKIKKSDT